MSEISLAISSSEAPQLSWVLPMFRTADQLRELLARIHAVSAELVEAHEIILVDDACPEGTGALAATIAATDVRVRLLRLASNRGQDAALREGLRLSRGEWTMILDADLQDPPEAVRQLWPLRQCGDAVFVERTGTYTSAGRQITSRLYRAAIARVGRLPRGACLFALLGRPLVDRINVTITGRQVSLLALISAAGFGFSSIPIVRSPRASGVSSYSSFARCAKAMNSLWQMFVVRRLNGSVHTPSRPSSAP